jgi:hypothetical protein
MAKQMINKVKCSGKTLKLSNVHLRSSKARELRIRSLASSTAIETGESITAIETKLHNLGTSGYRLTLA